MTPRLNSIMLIDDNSDDNFFHERIIRKNNFANEVIVIESGTLAIEYLRKKQFTYNSPPELILLDINMPGMNGWEFLKEYDTLDLEIKSTVIVTMLTTSDHPDDAVKASELMPFPLKQFKTKPLTSEMLTEIVNKYFSDRKAGVFSH